MYIIKIFGGSCTYYVEQDSGNQWAFTTKRASAQEFTTETDALLVGQGLYRSGKIGHWEVIRVKEDPFFRPVLHGIGQGDESR